MANQFRNYLLTVNNPVQTDDEFMEYIKSLAHVKYAVFQREMGNETHTPHFQVYIEFHVGKTFDTLKKYFPTAHIEQRKGTKEQARKYCMKDDGTRVGEPREYGEFVESGERSDLCDIIALVESGSTDDEIRKLYPSQYFRYYKNIAHIRQLCVIQKYSTAKRDVFVTYIFGKTGQGKTSFVTNKHGYENVYVVDDYKNPFDLYEYQDVILFDEFRSQFDISRMLRWLDIHPVILPARYNNRQACYTKAYITSNIPLDQQYKKVQTDEPETWRAFLRRIHAVENFDVPKQETMPW